MIADTRSHVPEGGSTGKASAASQLGTFDVKDAHCFSSDDEVVSTIVIVGNKNCVLIAIAAKGDA